jgi:hypothetical protein
MTTRKDTLGRETAEQYPHLYAGLGLILGTAIGAAMSMVLEGPIYLAGFGTGAGLVIGAAIDRLLDQ